MTENMNYTAIATNAAVVLHEIYWFTRSFNSKVYTSASSAIYGFTTKLATDKPAAFFDERNGDKQPLSENKSDQQWDDQQYQCNYP